MLYKNHKNTIKHKKSKKNKKHKKQNPKHTKHKTKNKTHRGYKQNKTKLKSTRNQNTHTKQTQKHKEQKWKQNKKHPKTNPKNHKNTKKRHLIYSAQKSFSTFLIMTVFRQHLIWMPSCVFIFFSSKTFQEFWLELSGIIVLILDFWIPSPPNLSSFNWHYIILKSQIQ